MLTPHVDHLFDLGVITFSGKGNLVYSPGLRPRTNVASKPILGYEFG